MSAAALALSTENGFSDASTPVPSFFDSKEVRSNDIAPFHKWISALSGAYSEAASVAACPVTGGGSRACQYASWLAFLDTIRGLDKKSQLQIVNKKMNANSYITDPVNWGVDDYWESPGEFVTFFGDCEDYAIAKYFSLRRLGWSVNDMRIVAVMDENLHVGHAVLIVFLAGKALLLDNQIDQVIPADKVHHYLPVFSINETTWWRHYPRDR